MVRSGYVFLGVMTDVKFCLCHTVLSYFCPQILHAHGRVCTIQKPSLIELGGSERIDIMSSTDQVVTEEDRGCKVQDRS